MHSKLETMHKTVYYAVAGLGLELQVPQTFNLDVILPSFTDFKSKFSEEIPIISRVEVSFNELSYDLKEAKLLSDISNFWHDRFKFYEYGDQYLTILKSEDGQFEWSMLSSKDFKKVRIKAASFNKYKENVLTWFLMVIFAQASLSENTILIHASVVENGLNAFAFLGKSGTGKSTHSRLWLENIPGFSLLNDDNPAIRLINGEVFIFGTPWSGKTACYRNEKRKLAGFVRLKQGPQNTLTFMENTDKLISVLPSCSAIRWNADLFSSMTDILIQIAQIIPIANLVCLPNAEAASLSYTNLST